VLEFLADTGVGEMMDHMGINAQNVSLAVRLADIDGDNSVSMKEFIQAMHTLHDGSQKRDVWELNLTARAQGNKIDELTQDVKRLAETVSAMDAKLSETLTLMRELRNHN